MTCLLVKRTTRRYLGLAYYTKQSVRVQHPTSRLSHLVLRLRHESTTGKVICPPFPTPSRLHLVPAEGHMSACPGFAKEVAELDGASGLYAREVGGTLDLLDEWHLGGSMVDKTTVELGWQNFLRRFVGAELERKRSCGGLRTVSLSFPLPVYHVDLPVQCPARIVVHSLLVSFVENRPPPSGP